MSRPKRKSPQQVNADYRASAGGKSARWRAQDARNRAFTAFLASVKNVPCADCRGRFPAVCMDFDHRPGTAKTCSVSAMTSHRREAVRREIAKCDIVCANCHRIRTANRNVQREYWQSRRRGGLVEVAPAQLRLGIEASP